MAAIDMFSSDALRQKLHSASLDKQPAGISVYAYNAGSYSEASVNNFGILDTVSIGCVTKTLTASLVAIAQIDSELHLDTPLTDCFPEIKATFTDVDRFGTPRIGDLLNHTNGLDSSNIPFLPRNSSGFIDADSLLASLNEFGALSRPGTIFNYSSIGSWLAAAILERVYERPYAQLLDTLLLRPLGISAIDNADPSFVCPSLGHQLRLSTNDLMKLALLHLYGDPDRPGLKEKLLALRSQYGFRPQNAVLNIEQIYPAWFDFGGSFGHYGYSGNTAAAIRVMPEQDIAIAVTAEHPKLANATLAVVFKELLPDFSSAPVPRLLSPPEWANTDQSAYKGTYENARYRLIVDTAANKYLRAKVFRKRNDEGHSDTDPYIKRYFNAFENDKFFPLEPEPLVCPTLQFSHRQDNAAFRYANTGKGLFVRVC